MKEDLPWFKHKKDARHASGAKALIAEYGFEGYGRFSALLEIISSQPGACLDLSLKKNRSGYAGELRMTPADFDAFLNFLADEDECGLIRYEDGIVTSEDIEKDYSRVEQKRGSNKQSYQSRQPSDNRQTSETPIQTTETPNQSSELIQSRAEQSRREKSSSSARADDIPRDDPGLLAYALDLAKKAKARNPGAYARTLLDKSDVIAAYRESLVLPEPEPSRPPPPKTCSECSGKITLIAGEAVCGKCGAAWTWYDDWQSWERSPESYQRVDLSALKPA